MIISFTQVNYIAVLIASIVVIIVGFLWYSPLLFGNQWVKLQEKKKEAIKGPSKQTFFLVPITTLIGTWVIALLLTIIEEPSLCSTLMIAFLVALFTSIKIGMNHLFEFRPIGYYLITIGHHIVCSLITGLILYLFA